MAVQETTTLPAPFVEDIGKDLAEQARSKHWCTSCNNWYYRYITTTR